MIFFPWNLSSNKNSNYCKISNYSFKLTRFYCISFLESPSVTSRFARRTHTCGDLNENTIGQEVHLCGWVELKRLGRFLTLRDGYGATQLVAPNNVRKHI
jgi:hypothetical protein